MDGHAVSPFDLSRTLPVGGGLLVLHSLSGPPVIKQLMQMVTMVPGQGAGSNHCASLSSACIFKCSILCVLNRKFLFLLKSLENFRLKFKIIYKLSVGHF